MMNLIRALLLPVVLIIGILIGSVMDKSSVEAQSKPTWYTVIPDSNQMRGAFKFYDGNFTCYAYYSSLSCVRNDR